MYTLAILIISLAGEPLYQEAMRVEECPDKEQVQWAVEAFAEIQEIGAVKYKWVCIPDEKV